jgi:hypothetical protein
MRITTLIAATALALLASPATAATNVVVNGSFETPDTGVFVTDPGAGWTTSNVDFVDNGFFGSGFAYAGSQVVDLVGTGTSGSLSQIFAAASGQLYNFSFRYTGNVRLTPSAQTVTATITDGSSSIFSTGSLAAPDGAGFSSNWQLFSGTFIGTGNPLTVTFAGTGAGNEGAALDDVQISAAPEPSTWLTMILGFGLVGAGLRRRRGMGNLAAA